MDIVDKKGLLGNIKEFKELTLELGCGNHKRHKDAVCIDAIDYECVDIIGDIYDVLRKIPDGSVSAVYSYHCFEHLDDIGAVIEELSRILKRKGLLVVVVPHFSNPYFCSDYTHKTQFGFYSFSYLSKDSLFARKVPTYNNSLFNLNRYMMEFYEENLCYFIPCYEIRYEMIKKQSKSPVSGIEHENTPSQPLRSSWS